MKPYGEILETQLPMLPKDVLFCKKCVVSNQRPRIEFDADGVCSACRYAEEKDNVIDWKARETELLTLLDRYRSTDGSYDCVVPGSGGKDSSYVAHQLKFVYGMHPLTVTWAPHIYTDIGWQNYVAFKDSGFDNILVFPNGIIHRKLSKLAFYLLGDPFVPFIFGQRSIAFHVAVQFGIPLIFFGENGEIEYGGSTRFKNRAADEAASWNELYFHGAGVDELIRRGEFTKKELQSENFMFYRMPAIDRMKTLDPRMHWFSYYKKWIPQENYYYASEHCGFKPNPDGRSEGTYSKYASLDDKTDGFHWYLGYVKFGLGRASRDAQMEIRCRHLTREEGVGLVRRYDHEFPSKYFKEFLEYLGISEQEFFRVVDSYRMPHLWEKTGDGWRLKHVVS